jgi:hypothetical protein
MHLALQNAETINRLVDQGEFLLKSFHDERRKEPRRLGKKHLSSVSNCEQTGILRVLDSRG